MGSKWRCCEYAEMVSATLGSEPKRDARRVEPFEFGTLLDEKLLKAGHGPERVLAHVLIIRYDEDDVGLLVGLALLLRGSRKYRSARKSRRKSEEPGGQGCSTDHSGRSSSEDLWSRCAARPGSARAQAKKGERTRRTSPFASTRCPFPAVKSGLPDESCRPCSLAGSAENSGSRRRQKRTRGG